MRLVIIASIQMLFASVLISGAAVSQNKDLASVNAVSAVNKTGKALIDSIRLPYDRIFMNFITSQLGMAKPWKLDQPSIEKIKYFIATHKEVIFSGVAGALILVAILLIVSQFTGLDSALKNVGSGLNRVKNRVDDFDVKPDTERLSLLTNRVFKAIDAWNWKLENSAEEHFEGDYEDE